MQFALPYKTHTYKQDTLDSFDNHYTKLSKKYHTLTKTLNKPSLPSKLDKHTTKFNSLQVYQKDEPFIIPGIKALFQQTFNPIMQSTMRHSSNLQKNEQAAIKSISYNKNVIVTKADKGGGVVVTSREEYIGEGERIFSNTQNYVNITQDIVPADYLLKLTRLSNGIYCKLFKDHCLNGRMKQKALSPSFTFATTYLLFKVHKPKQENGTYKGRPIISNFNTPFKYLDRYCEFLLSPLLSYVPSRIKNNLHLLQKLTNQTYNTSSTLSSLDVSDMYPSIPHWEAAGAIKDIYTQLKHSLELFFKQKYSLNIPTPAYVQFCILTLFRNSIFTFNCQYYKATKGIPMGSNISVIIAELYVFQKIERELNLHHLNVALYGRYIDDIIIISHALNFSPSNIKTHIETLSPLIFTVEGPNKTLNFLDLTLHIANNALHFKPYSKPSSAHDYIHYNSEHPDTVKHSLITSFLSKYRLISSNEPAYQNAISDIYHYLLRRGYPAHYLQKIYNMKPREKAIIQLGIPFILPYSRTFQRLMKRAFNSYKTGLRDLYNDLQGVEILTPTLIYKGGKTLGSLLTKNRKNCSAIF